MGKRHRHPGLHALQGGAGPARDQGDSPPISLDGHSLARRVGKEMATEIAEALAEVLRREAESEYKFSLQDPWSVQLFIAVARKHGLRPYREKGQKSQTVMVRATKSVIDGQVWPEFTALADRLHAALHQVTDDLIRDAVGAEHGAE